MLCGKPTVQTRSHSPVRIEVCVDLFAHTSSGTAWWHPLGVGGLYRHSMNRECHLRLQLSSSPDAVGNHNRGLCRAPCFNFSRFQTGSVPTVSQHHLAEATEALGVCMLRLRPLVHLTCSAISCIDHCDNGRGRRKQQRPMKRLSKMIQLRHL